MSTVWMGYPCPGREVRDCLIGGWVLAAIPERKTTQETLSCALSSLYSAALEALRESKSKAWCHGTTHQRVLTTNTELLDKATLFTLHRALV